MSIVTWEMISAYAAHFGIDITSVQGVVGSIEAWVSGHGELDSTLVTGTPELTATFAPVVAAYNAAHTVAAPEVAPEAAPAPEVVPVEPAPTGEVVPPAAAM